MITIRSATVFINDLLKFALKANATDIHFYPNNSTTSIYFRIYGLRKFHKNIPIDQYAMILNYIKFSAGMDIGEVRKPQDGAISLTDYFQDVNLRLSTLPTSHSESLAIRILPINKASTLKDLLLFSYQAKQLQQSLDKKSGIILLTGSTGSGKTTLLYALIEELLMKQQYQIITLEDPIEKEIFNVLQVQINEKSGVTYQAGLKSALRHDPDILMVGEIRDQETAKFVFHAAYTGHLVFTTLHARDAIGTIHRLLEMGIKEVDIAQNLLTVASLELIPLSLEKNVNGRAAITEIINNDSISAYLQTFDQQVFNYQTFDYLKRKAVAYGYSSPQIIQSKKAPHLSHTAN